MNGISGCNAVATQMIFVFSSLLISVVSDMKFSAMILFSLQAMNEWIDSYLPESRRKMQLLAADVKELIEAPTPTETHVYYSCFLK